MIAPASLRRDLRGEGTSIQVITSVAGLLEHEEAWRAVEALDSSSTVFSTWEWNQAAALHLLEANARLLTLVIDDGGETAGLAALGLRPWHSLRTLAFLGTGLRDYSRADYQDILAADGSRGTVARAVCDALAQRRREWDMVWLQELPPDSTTPAVLGDEARRRGWIVEEADGSDVHWLELPETWQQFREAISGNTREAIERKARKVSREKGAVMRRVERRAELEAGMSALFALHTARWRETGSAGIFPSQRSQSFHRELAESLFRAGMLDLALLATEDGPVGARYSFSHKGKHYFYANGYESAGDWARYSLGLVMDGLAIRAAIEAGFEREDFLRGEGHYKGRYGTYERFNRELRIFHSRRHYARYRLISWLRGALRRGRDAVRSLRRRGGARG